MPRPRASASSSVMSKPSSCRRATSRILRSRRAACWSNTHVRNSLSAVVAQKVAQQVNRMTVQLGGKLDPAHQFHARRRRMRPRLVVALEGVVIRDAERAHAGANRFLDQLRRRTRAVGFVSV